MRLTDLSPETIAKFIDWRFDRFLEKHEGPWDWRTRLEHKWSEFIELDGYWVLLPVEKGNHRHITPVKSFLSEGGELLTVFLKDRTYLYLDAGEGEDDDGEAEAEIDEEALRHEAFYTGFAAICHKVEGEDFFVAIFYHQWYNAGEPLPK